MDATAQAGLIRSGEASPRELTEAAIERIEALNGELNAVIHPLFEKALATEPADGPRRVTAFIVVVICSDIGGYATGVLFGRHPMAPSVSPKKSWEGFAGSLTACAVGGTLLFWTLFDVQPLFGAVYGLAVVCTATLGDLGESMVKRDIGIKDMGTLLPGHGGVMDRLDSLLPTAPVAYVLLGAFL